MQHSFSQVPTADIRRSSFKRNCGYKTAFDAGYLVPFFVDEVLPGDTFNLDLALFARMSTPIVPVMDNIYLDTFFFFVPNRLVWDNFKKQMGEQDNPGDSIDYLTPQIDFGEKGVEVGTTADYVGLPINSTSEKVNALPFRAMNLIWNEWFRDENLQDRLEVPKDDGPDLFYQPIDLTKGYDTAFYRYPLFKRGKRHDYFTSALPWPQKGPGVDLPLGSTAPVIGNGKVLGLSSGDKWYGLSVSEGVVGVDHGGYLTGNVGLQGSDAGSAVGSLPNAEASAGKGIGVVTSAENSGLIADLSGADPVTINQLRQAFMLQQLLERDARGGSRYIELLRSHFSVVCPDFRLQRPEYLGGSSGLINVHQVAQTSSTDSATPQGNLAAYATYSDTHNGFVKSFVEHGYVIGFVCVRADLSYQQGIERHWSKRTRYDYYWPSLAHLGEQAILNKEIYAAPPGDNSGNDDVFGYQERYAEYRYKPSLVTGKLRSGTGNSLDVWHLAQYFENRPVLNSEFIEENPPIARALAVQDEPQFILDAYFSLNCVRPMPVHGIPGFQAHF